MQQCLYKFKLFYFSIRYTRPKQLIARLRLLLKRKILSHLAPELLKKNTAIAKNTKLKQCENVPSPIFLPRKQFIVNNSPLVLKFLNVERVLADPIDWRPEDLKVGTRLWLLNLHYFEFIESLQDEQLICIVIHWIENNRPYEPGYWLDNWNCYSMSIRVVVWMQQVAKRQSAVVQESLDLIHSSLIAQMRFLVANLELDIGGNHLIKNIKALLWASKFFEGSEAEQWQRLGARLLERELAEQILEDGMHYELSPAYHCQVFADLLECFKVLDAGKCKELLQLKLAKIVQVVSDFTHPDGKISLFNDSGLNMAYSPSECIKVYEKIFPRKKIEKQQIVNYETAGYFGLHCGDETVIVDSGELAPDYLPAHGHGDALAFEWSIGEQRIVIDPGVYEYNAGEWRDYSRSTRSHNTVTLNNQDQSEFWQAFRVGRRAKIISRKVDQTDNSMIIDASHDGYQRLEGSPTHRRVFDLKLGRIHIQDFIIGGKGQKAVSRIMLHPECIVDLTGQHKATIERGDINIELECDGNISIRDCWCFFDFGEKHKTKQLIIEIGNAPCSGELTLTRCS